MAILSFYRCQILVNNEAVLEYEDDTEATPDGPIPTAVKYVEAISGANFSIKFSLFPQSKFEGELAMQVYLDGTMTTSVVIRCGGSSFDNNCWKEDGAIVGRDNEWYLKKFKFADIVTGDTENHFTPKEMNAKYSSLGLIRVEFWRFDTEYTKSLEESARTIQNPQLGTVPEKALKGKALSLSASFGDTIPSRGRPECRGTYLDSIPVAAFDFKYRSRTALQQLMIIPRSPSPVPLEQKSIDDLTAEEARELVRRQNVRIETAEAKLKSESKSKLKRERSSTTNGTKRAKVVRTADGKEYIDLASDSEDGSAAAEHNGSDRGVTKTDSKIEVLDLID
ncbi:hypothetical protein EPUS_01381 [Endocarpon pusillum Z07020]|uniref:DUF7918 domain-containing protein n=1 Tax=Endocarpon pusillum (strain Z07020 / HMAS-L-300199) TaxID=1263415 RepID=U1GUB6_ENDPU|nr:uncharacterized protein EPUS_01381 [Endocarpon pusillum Z07020]ERF76048.1 hypothetical protein EPUS_01381 [Endocarpon pusillum Z07020]